MRRNENASQAIPTAVMTATAWMLSAADRTAFHLVTTKNSERQPQQVLRDQLDGPVPSAVTVRTRRVRGARVVVLMTGLRSGVPLDDAEFSRGRG